MSMIVGLCPNRLKGRIIISLSLDRLWLLRWRMGSRSRSELRDRSVTSGSNDSFRHVGILNIQGSHFQISEIPLKTVRPFIFDEVVLSTEAEKPGNEMDLEDKDSITAFLRAKVSSPLVWVYTCRGSADTLGGSYGGEGQGSMGGNTRWE